MNFTPEQQAILDQIFSEAFARAQKSRGVALPAATPEKETVYGTPVGDLCKEERWKLEENPLDIWEKIVRHASANEFPKDADVFRFKFHGLFYVAPAENFFMLRMRIPGCRLTSAQARAVAEISTKWGSGNVDITTRGNLQIRRIEPKNILSVLTRLYDAGLTSKGSGADNIRNITASPTSGFDANEIIDVLPYALSLHHYILNSRDLYGLPRKFNVAFDNGGAVSVAVDTNDIGFVPLRLTGDPRLADGVYFRVLLAGVTGHGHFARDAGILVRADDAVSLAVAIIKVFIAHGDRTNRKKARLVYLIEKWGLQKFLAETQKHLSFPLVFSAPDEHPANYNKLPHAHIGVFKQKEAGLNYVGVVTPVGRLSANEFTGLANLAEKFGKGEMRLTVWQNLIVPHISDANLEKFLKALGNLGFGYKASALAGGVVACTGNTGCRYAGANTKDTAIETIKYLESRVTLDRAINIHFTGCPNSCAQHYVGDIGLMGVPIAEGEGFNITLGGGMDEGRNIGREIFWKVPRSEVPRRIESILKTYLERRNTGESFAEFTRRHDVKTLQEFFS